MGPEFLVLRRRQTISGPSDANPPFAEADLHIVNRAGEILNSPGKWNRRDNRECPSAEKTYSLYRALEKATIEVTHNSNTGAVMQQAEIYRRDKGVKLQR